MSRAGRSGQFGDERGRSIRRSVWLTLSAVAVLATLIGPGTTASAQQVLRADLVEDPFVCDGGTRIIGAVVGFSPGEDALFSSPQIDGGLDGIFSTREANDRGIVEMKWSCDAPKTWQVNVRGRTSGRAVTFTITGATAPPPPDAPLGAAFDARSAMTVDEMAIWKDYSPYNGVGIYIPVDSAWDNRADKTQANLTPAWVDAVLADGWRILPIYVGHQAPASCDTGHYVNMSSSPDQARVQGTAAGLDAAARANDLGIAPVAPIYLDIEAYRPGCTAAVLAYVAGWTEALHTRDYISGVYGSQNSMMVDLTDAARAGTPNLPDAIWVSTKSNVAATLGLEAPPDDLWTHERINQYRLSVTRTYGGVTREVDDNIVDAPVALWRAPVVDNDGDGHAEPEPDNCDSIPNPDQADLDGDGDGDVCDDDIDGDGHNNPSPDNCDLIANPDQADLDGDGDGDVCDPDIDGDSIPNDVDPDPNVTNGAAVPVAEPEPTSQPEPEPTETAADEPGSVTSPEPTELGESSDNGTEISVPPDDATVEPTPSAGVILLPTPATQAPVVSPTPTVGGPQPTAVGESDQAGSAPNSTQPQSATVTIEHEPSGFDWRPIGIVASAAAAVGFGVQAARSATRGRARGAR